MSSLEYRPEFDLRTSQRKLRKKIFKNDEVTPADLLQAIQDVVASRIEAGYPGLGRMLWRDLINHIALYPAYQTRLLISYIPDAQIPEEGTVPVAWVKVLQNGQEQAYEVVETSPNEYVYREIEIKSGNILLEPPARSLKELHTLLYLAQMDPRIHRFIRKDFYPQRIRQ